MENGLVEGSAQENSAVKNQAVDVSVLVQWRDAAEEATLDARKYAERDRDYYDNKQLTAKELATLKKRGQPPTIFNRIKRKINFLGGLEKRQRAMPKATPRNPVDAEDASAATDALRFVVEQEDYAAKRSQVWKNMCIEGFGGYEVAIEYKQYGPCVVIRRLPWDRTFYDPHSSAPDFSDAMYLGVDVWMDEDDAKHQYKDVENLNDILAASYKSAPVKSDTYEDKPKSGVWADRKRRRIRISQMYFKANGSWYFAEFTYGGLLKGGPSPYVNEDGEPDCAIALQSAYVDRDNNRYGEVRELISPQDAFNKRHSKLLHQLTMRQIRIDTTAGGVQDIEQVRKETMRVDGVIDAPKDALEILSNSDQAAGNFQLLNLTGQELDAIGANSALLGEQGGAPSGKAIQLNQSGGMVELGDLFDGLRHLDVRIFRMCWNRIQQFMDAEWWVNVTDDERTVRFVGYNVDPMKRFAMEMQGGGQLPENVRILDRPVGELDVDIIIDDAPDGIAPQQEQFQSLVELKQADPQSIPTELLIEAMPNLRNKGKILDHIEKMRQPDPMMQQIQQAGMVAEIENVESETDKNRTQAQLNMAKIHQGQSDAFAKLLTAIRPQEPRANELSR